MKQLLLYEIDGGRIVFVKRNPDDIKSFGKMLWETADLTRGYQKYSVS